MDKRPNDASGGSVCIFQISSGDTVICPKAQSNQPGERLTPSQPLLNATFLRLCTTKMVISSSLIAPVATVAIPFELLNLGEGLDTEGHLCGLVKDGFRVLVPMPAGALSGRHSSLSRAILE